MTGQEVAASVASAPCAACSPGSPVRPEEPPPTGCPAPVRPDPRAAELRARLAESKEAEAAEPAVPTAVAEPEPAGGEDPEERRKHVHERGRAALDEMHRRD
jgi:hypothetical protein